MSTRTVVCETCGGLGEQLQIDYEEYDADGNATPVGEWVDCDDCEGEGEWEEEVVDERAAKLARIDADGFTDEHLTAPGHVAGSCPWYCPVAYPRER